VLHGVLECSSAVSHVLVGASALNSPTMNHHSQNAASITAFYTALSRADTPTMLALYAPNAQFEDPMFGVLDARQARAMWRMLTRSGQSVQVALSNIQANDTDGSAHVDSEFVFPQTGRTVNNHVDASFKFDGGKIVYHREDYDLHAWIQMALGVPTVTPELEAQFRAQFQGGLAQMMAAMPD
jgi:ketosteroid isomerase-like protein